MNHNPRFKPVYTIAEHHLKKLPSLHVPSPDSNPLDLHSLFDREAPLEIDVGCGKGRFLIARAKKFPDHNFIAIERKLSRILKVQKKITAAALTNIRLLQVEASHAIKVLIRDHCVSACHIFFPDPWPRRRHFHRRLFSDEFQSDLWRKLAHLGQINFATDHMEYFAHVESKMAIDPRFRRTETYITPEDEQSEFEQIFLCKGDPIGRCSFVKVSDN